MFNQYKINRANAKLQKALIKFKGARRIMEEAAAEELKLAWLMEDAKKAMDDEAKLQKEERDKAQAQKTNISNPDAELKQLKKRISNNMMKMIQLRKEWESKKQEFENAKQVFENAKKVFENAEQKFIKAQTKVQTLSKSLNQHIHLNGGKRRRKTRKRVSKTKRKTTKRTSRKRRSRKVSRRKTRKRASKSTKRKSRKHVTKKRRSRKVSSY